MKRLAPLAALALSGCITTMDSMTTKPPQDEVTTPRSMREVRDCLVSTLGVMRTPLETGDDQRKVLAFSTAEAGVIFHYTLTPVGSGTRVIARRKNAIADGFTAARACYPAF